MSSPVTHLKRLLFGQSLASERLEHERLDKKTALAVKHEVLRQLAGPTYRDADEE